MNNRVYGKHGKHVMTIESIPKYCFFFVLVFINDVLIRPQSFSGQLVVSIKIIQFNAEHEPTLTLVLTCEFLYFYCAPSVDFISLDGKNEGQVNLRRVETRSICIDETHLKFICKIIIFV